MHIHTRVCTHILSRTVAGKGLPRAWSWGRYDKRYQWVEENKYERDVTFLGRAGILEAFLASVPRPRLELKVPVNMHGS